MQLSQRPFEAKDKDRQARIIKRGTKGFLHDFPTVAAHGGYIFVSFVPPRQLVSFEHFVGSTQYELRHRQADRFSGLKVDRQLKRARESYGQFADLRAA
jgi:hypothetical protein